MMEQKTSIPQHERDEKGAWKNIDMPFKSEIELDREQLELIVRCDPSVLLRHLKEDTGFDSNLIARMIELGKERARERLYMTAERAAFEKCERTRFGFGPDTLTRYEGDSEQYLLPLVQARWEGWQASRTTPRNSL
jgi:hypothetical protein